MNAHAASTLARIAAVAVVLTLAATVGLVAGNWMRSADADLSAGAGVPTVAYPAFQQIESAAGFDGAPAYADPHRQIIAAAADAAGAGAIPALAYPAFQQIESAAGFDGAPAYADPHRQIIAAAADAAGAGAIPALAYPAFQQIEAVVEADEPFTQTWGNLDERSGGATGAEDADGTAELKASPRMPRGPSPR